MLYAIIVNYLNAVEAVFWRNAFPGSFIVRTIGVQALFDILRRIARDAYDARDTSVAAFERRLKPTGGIDFAQIEYQNASGAGRSDIRRAIEGALGFTAAWTATILKLISSTRSPAVSSTLPAD